MYKVRISTGNGESTGERDMLRQLPGGQNVSRCGKYRFYINEPVKDPDFWVVRNKHIKHKETVNIAPENTVLMISEPRTVVNFPRAYRDQFGVLCTCQEEISHDRAVYGPPALTWHVSTSRKASKDIPRDYDALKRSETPRKSKLISVITSDKSFTKGHWDRIKFVERLKLHYGDKIDVFGRGFNSFEDKWDVLAPYKYHIALENTSARYYWTEKISDCYLTETFPIYYGCSNLSDYFPEGSFKTIDIADFDHAVAMIDKVIADDLFAQSRDVLRRSKELVLNDYNVFELISRCLDQLDPSKEKRRVTLKPANTLLDWHNLYVFFIDRNIFALKKLLSKRSVLNVDLTDA